jgi:membrane associated rhomboid family serine protease
MAVYIFEILLEHIYGYEHLVQFIGTFGFSFENLLAGKWWTLITSIFVHAGPDHLILNLIGLFFFGRVLEENIGFQRTAMVFFGAAIFGSIAVLASSALGLMPMAIPTVGASAAIFGLLGTAMIIKPGEMVFYPYLVPVPLILVALLYTLFNIADFAAVILAGKETNVAYAAHLGGLFIGMLYGFKKGGAKKGLLVILIIFAFLLLIPVIWQYISYLEMTNYISMITQVIK